VIARLHERSMAQRIAKTIARGRMVRTTSTNYAAPDEPA
jgi:hypothetical protein